MRRRMSRLSELARLNPDMLALADGERQWTWAELHAAATATAERLRDSAGLREGDVLATLAGNSAEHVILLLATWLCGATVAPLNTRLAPAEIRKQIEHLRPKGMVSDNQTVFTDMLQHALSDIVVNEAADARRAETLSPGGDPADDTLCSILFTSGTSGVLKAVPHTWGNHRASAAGSAENLGVRPDDNWLCVIPLFHIGGLAIVTRCLQYGIAMTVRQGFDAAAVARELRERRVTLLSVVPTMFSRLLAEDATLSAATVPALRAILLGGAAAAPSLWDAARERRLPVLGTYGLTESCSQVVTAAPDKAEEMAGTAGRPIPGAELRIVDAEDRDVPAGAAGEILLRGPMLTKGYYRDEALSARSFIDGWFRTRDIGSMDDAGLLRVHGRQDDMIITGGENVFPTEVEEVLLRHPAVRDAAVAGIPDEEWGARLGALLVLDGDENLGELEHWCRRELAGYKIPRSWRRVPEIPRTASGKIIRAEVRRLLRVCDPTTRPDNK